MEMIINNKKYNIIVADTLFKKFIGLMGKKSITIGMFFPKIKGIHTFFMKDNIDIIMINKDNKVIYFEKNVKKNRIIIKKEAYHTIELPKGSLTNININDKLIID